MGSRKDHRQTNNLVFSAPGQPNGTLPDTTTNTTPSTTPSTTPELFEYDSSVSSTSSRESDSQDEETNELARTPYEQLETPAEQASQTFNGYNNSKHWNGHSEQPSNERNRQACTTGNNIAEHEPALTEDAFNYKIDDQIANGRRVTTILDRFREQEKYQEVYHALQALEGLEDQNFLWERFYAFDNEIAEFNRKHPTPFDQLPKEQLIRHVLNMGSKIRQRLGIATKPRYLVHSKENLKNIRQQSLAIQNIREHIQQQYIRHKRLEDCCRSADDFLKFCHHNRRLSQLDNYFTTASRNTKHLVNQFLQKKTKQVADIMTLPQRQQGQVCQLLELKRQRQTIKHALELTLIKPKQIFHIHNPSVKQQFKTHQTSLHNQNPSKYSSYDRINKKYEELSSQLSQPETYYLNPQAIQDDNNEYTALKDRIFNSLVDRDYLHAGFDQKVIDKVDKFKSLQKELEQIKYTLKDIDSASNPKRTCLYNTAICAGAITVGLLPSFIHPVGGPIIGLGVIATSIIWLYQSWFNYENQQVQCSAINLVNQFDGYCDNKLYYDNEQIHHKTSGANEFRQQLYYTFFAPNQLFDNTEQITHNKTQ